MTVLLMKQSDRLDYECAKIYRHCIMERIPTRCFSPVDMVHGLVDLSDCSLVVGSVESVSAALTQLSIPIPQSNYYPPQLNTYLHRSVFKGTLKDLETHIAIGDFPIFAKSVQWKMFTGRLFDDSNSFTLLSTRPKKTKIWLSTPVQWVSEYRVYVLNNEILAISNYQGDESVTIDLDIIDQAVSLIAHHYDYASYSFDWGVLSTGETALVEMNDAWAIGEYGDLTPSQYFEFLSARWNQLVNK